jgi:hypothetical protein
MSLHQRPNLPEFELHPEFGYLCPSRQLRQNVRVGLAACAFGIVLGVAGAVVLLPRHGGDRARAEPVPAVALSGPVEDSTPPTASSPSIAPAQAPSGTAERAATDGVVKQLPPPAPTSRAVEAGNEAPPPPVQTPAQAASVTTERGTAAASEPEQGRAVASKKRKTVHSSSRRRVRKPDPRASYATSPFGFHQANPYADGARNGRRQDWGESWRW